MPAVARKTAARARPAPPRPDAPPSWLLRFLRQLYQPGVLFPTALALAAIVTWPYLPAWTPDLSVDPAYQVTAERLQLPAAHQWIPHNFRGRVLRRAGGTSEQPLSLLRDGLSERLAESLAAEPWVREVTRVELHRDGVIAVDLTFRRPVLMVSTARGMYAVDETGVLLPPEDFRAEDIRQFPLARQPQSLPNVPAGQVWNDAGVQQAAHLAAALFPTGSSSDPWRSLELAAILIPSAAAQEGTQGPLTFEILTAGGSRILWGHAPGTDSLEPSTEQKLARLVYYREQCGGFETAQGPTRIDIRDIKVIYAGSLDEERR
ncbi:MAG: hypothetical protein ACK5Q5_17605 [Planctomycetaceae bacterium]